MTAGNGIGAPVATTGTHTEIVTISGFTLKGGAQLLEPVLETENSLGAGVFVTNVAFATVSDNVITGNRGCHGSGIVAFWSNISIHDNVVRANEPMDWCPNNGITMRLGGHDLEDRDATVERNQVVGNGGLGMSVIVFRDAVVRGNTITDNGQFIDHAYNGGGIEFGISGGLIANNFIARNKGTVSAGLNVGNYPEPARNVLVIGNVIVDNFSEETLGPRAHVALGTFLPSNTQFTGNLVVGDMPGAIVECPYGGAHVYGNVIINRNPQGTTVRCD